VAKKKHKNSSVSHLVRREFGEPAGGLDAERKICSESENEGGGGEERLFRRQRQTNKAPPWEKRKSSKGEFARRRNPPVSAA